MIPYLIYYISNDLKWFIYSSFPPAKGPPEMLRIFTGWKCRQFEYYFHEYFSQLKSCFLLLSLISPLPSVHCTVQALAFSFSFNSLYIHYARSRYSQLYFFKCIKSLATPTLCYFPLSLLYSRLSPSLSQTIYLSHLVYVYTNQSCSWLWPILHYLSPICDLQTFIYCLSAIYHLLFIYQYLSIYHLPAYQSSAFNVWGNLTFIFLCLIYLFHLLW